MMLLLASGVGILGQEQGVAQPQAGKPAEAGATNAVDPDKALELIKETRAEIEVLRSADNRISFSVTLADLAYETDPELSRIIYRNLAESLSRKISAVSSSLNSNGSNGGQNLGVKRSPYEGAYMQMIRMYQQRSTAVLSAATHDPLLALDIADKTKLEFSSASDEEDYAGRMYPGYDDEGNLVTEIVDRLIFTDGNGHEEFARRVIDRGFSSGAVSLLKKIRAQDPKRGSDYAREMLSAIRRESQVSLRTSHAFVDFLNYAAGELSSQSASANAYPLLTRSEAGEVAERFGRSVLQFEEEAMDEWSAWEFASAIEPYSPGLANQIKKRFVAEDSDLWSQDSSSDGESAAAVEAMKVAADEAAKDAAQAALKAAEGEDSEELSAEVIEKQLSLPEDDPRRGAAARRFAEQAILQANEAGDVIAMTRILVSASSVLREKGFSKLSADVLEEALRTAPTDPRSHKQFIQICVLAAGVAEIAPDQAFGMMEDLVFRLNGVASAFVALGEFMDDEGVMVEDGELQFAGPGAAFLSRAGAALDSSGVVVKSLVTADFGRTRLLAERFDRPEIRVAAKLLILKSIYGKPVIDETK